MDNRNTNKPYKNNKKADAIKAKIQNTPEHIRNLVYLVKNNAEIRRYTALGIINKLKQTGMIAKDASVFVKFYFNKYAIVINGLKQEFTYNNNLFITCLAASFPSFAHNANKIISTFISTENQTINVEEVEEMVEIIKDNTTSPVEEESDAEPDKE